MSTAGRIFAGAVKGVSKYGLDQLEQRQEEEREVRKAKLLNDLRMSTEKELATFEYDMKSKLGDKAFSSADEKDFIIRNSEGKEVGRRALTAAEIQERNMSLDKDRLDVENVRSQISSRARDDARQDRYTNASIANMNKKSSSLDGSDDGESSSNPNSFAQGLVSRYKGFLGQGDNSVDEQDAFELAKQALEYAATTNGNTKVAEDYYLKALRQLKESPDKKLPEGRARIIQ
jgi:hypothetical protein